MFSGVAPGRYALRAVSAGEDSLIYPLSVDAGLPIDVTLRFPPRVTGTVIVEAPLARDAVTSRASVAGASVDLVPVRIGARGIQDVVATLPGWATEDNGLMHIRGIDDGFLYVVDGVPVYERIDQLSGLGPDLSSVDSVSVITGYIPAEFGYKAGGVIDVRSKAAQKQWTGAAQVEQAIDEGTSGGASAGGRLGSNVTLQVGGTGQRSSRFLDPVHPDNLHNRGACARHGRPDRVAAGRARSRQYQLGRGQRVVSGPEYRGARSRGPGSAAGHFATPRVGVVAAHLVAGDGLASVGLCAACRLATSQQPARHALDRERRPDARARRRDRGCHAPVGQPSA